MFGGNAKLPKDLLERCKAVADAAGYSDANEFIIHALEKELGKLEDSGSDEDLKKKLQGLGYIS